MWLPLISCGFLCKKSDRTLSIFEKTIPIIKILDLHRASFLPLVKMKGKLLELGLENCELKKKMRGSTWPKIL